MRYTELEEEQQINTQDQEERWDKEKGKMKRYIWTPPLQDLSFALDDGHGTVFIEERGRIHGRLELAP